MSQMRGRGDLGLPRPQSRLCFLACKRVGQCHPTGMGSRSMSAASPLGLTLSEASRAGPVISKGATAAEDRLIGIVSWGLSECTNGTAPLRVAVDLASAASTTFLKGAGQ